MAFAPTVDRPATDFEGRCGGGNGIVGEKLSKCVRVHGCRVLNCDIGIYRRDPLRYPAIPRTRRITFVCTRDPCENIFRMGRSRTNLRRFTNRTRATSPHARSYRRFSHRPDATSGERKPRRMTLVCARRDIGVKRTPAGIRKHSSKTYPRH